MGKLLHSFKVDLIVPEAAAESLEALSVILPASDGQVGILAGRAPVVVRLGAGAMLIEGRDSRRKEYFVNGGFAQMRDDVLTVLADECTPIKRIDPDSAWSAIEQARAMPAETDEQLATREEALHIARTRFRLIQKLRGKTETPGKSIE